jgi:hypothetical protein
MKQRISAWWSRITTTVLNKKATTEEWDRYFSAVRVCTTTIVCLIMRRVPSENHNKGNLDFSGNDQILEDDYYYMEYCWKLSVVKRLK